jgi:two-component system response regulator AtoC
MVMHGKKILVIDDEENMRHFLTSLLTKEGYEVSLAADGLEGLQHIEEQIFDIILCDIRMPRMDGLEFLKNLQSKNSSATIITMSAYGTIDLAIETMQLGAYDYISKPFKPPEIILTLKKAEERERLRRENLILRQEVEQKYNFHNIIGKSPQIVSLCETIKKAAQHKIPVLITGESGTGKELVAKAIHYNSPRSHQIMLAINCSAIPETLLESELFGYKKGAFTGAISNHKGLFEEAHEGSIFLDEIGEISPALQVKLLRVLQEGEIRRLGEQHPVYVDVRIIAATAKDLSREVHRGAFREDLFYRLNVLPVPIPPLRERADDIPRLIDHFIQKYNASSNLHITGITPAALKTLINYRWPGNVRELENAIERSMVMTDGFKIDEQDLPESVCRKKTDNLEDTSETEYSIKKMEKMMEEKLIRKALERTRGNKSRAARILEISYPALLSKINEYRIEQ